MAKPNLIYKKIGPLTTSCFYSKVKITIFTVRKYVLSNCSIMVRANQLKITAASILTNSRYKIIVVRIKLFFFLYNKFDIVINNQ